MQNENDNAVDKVLAALRDAAPPEGMDTRIAHRLANTSPATSRLRSLFADYSPSGAWRRGVLTGAVFATLAIGMGIFTTHLLHTQTNHQLVAVSNTAPTHSLTPVSESRSQPCSNPSVIRIHNVAPAHHIEMLRPAVVERLRPLPSEPLTAQERDLVRLVHTSDPQQLATLNSETQAKMQAQDEAEFNKFFAPPTSTKSTGDNE